MRERDGIDPDCRTERGCLIPPLCADGSRVLKMRELLIGLWGLVDSAAILKLFDATKDDLESLVIVEEELKNCMENDR